jgi:uncharacterized protein YdcH (DUF465 family)
MGLSGEVFYLFEYDIPSAVKNQHKQELSSKYTAEQGRFFRKLRNLAMFELKFKIHAMQNLYSSWFVTENKLDLAKQLCATLKTELQNEGFPQYAKKVRIIPILTNEAGAEAFEDKMAEYLVQFAIESIKQVDKGIHDQIMSESLLWRCKKAVEAIDTLKEELNGNEAFNEIVDAVEELDDKINQYEAIKKAKKEKQAK